jgi:hypothetical protein
MRVPGLSDLLVVLLLLILAAGIPALAIIFFGKFIGSRLHLHKDSTWLLIAVALLVLFAGAYSAMAQVALAPRWDTKAANERLTDADRAKAKRFQDAPWVEPDTRLRPPAVRVEPTK